MLKGILHQMTRRCPKSDSDARISLSKITKIFVGGQNLCFFFPSSNLGIADLVWLNLSRKKCSYRGVKKAASWVGYHILNGSMQCYGRCGYNSSCLSYMEKELRVPAVSSIQVHQKCWAMFTSFSRKQEILLPPSHSQENIKRPCSRSKWVSREHRMKLS